MLSPRPSSTRTSTSTIKKPPRDPHTPPASLPSLHRNHSRTGRPPRSRHLQRNATAPLRLASGCEPKTGFPQQPAPQVDPPTCNRPTTRPLEEHLDAQPANRRETIRRTHKHPNGRPIGHSWF